MKKILTNTLLLLAFSLSAQDKFYTKGLVNGYGWIESNSNNTSFLYSKSESLTEALRYRIQMPYQNSMQKNLSFPLDCEDDIITLGKINGSKTIDIDVIVKMIDEFYAKKENLIIPVLGAYCCSVKKLSGVSPEEIEKYRSKLFEYSKN
jgi:hypothetical protein